MSGRERAFVMVGVVVAMFAVAAAVATGLVGLR